MNDDRNAVAILPCPPSWPPLPWSLMAEVDFIEFHGVRDISRLLKLNCRLFQGHVTQPVLRIVMSGERNATNDDWDVKIEFEPVSHPEIEEEPITLKELKDAAETVPIYKSRGERS